MVDLSFNNKVLGYQERTAGMIEMARLTSIY